MGSITYPLSNFNCRWKKGERISKFTPYFIMVWLLVHARMLVNPSPHERGPRCWNHNIPLQWRHNGHDGVSNHQPHDCLLDGLLRRRSRKTSKLRVTGLCAGNSPVTGEFPAQRPVTRKMFPCDDVIMPGEIYQYHGWWCPDCLCCQDIKSHDI